MTINWNIQIKEDRSNEREEKILKKSLQNCSVEQCLGLV